MGFPTLCREKSRLESSLVQITVSPCIAVESRKPCSQMLLHLVLLWSFLPTATSPSYWCSRSCPSPIPLHLLLFQSPQRLKLRSRRGWAGRESREDSRGPQREEGKLLPLSLPAPRALVSLWTPTSRLRGLINLQQPYRWGNVGDQLFHGCVTGWKSGKWEKGAVERNRNWTLKRK